jgi:hypothetical protein
MAYMRHFKMSYDPKLHDQIPEISRQLYGDNKALVVAEKLHVNAHIHFQGYTDLTEQSFRNKLGVLTKDHYMRRSLPGQPKYPVKCVKREADDMGFQYLCKEDPPNVLYKNHFTDEDIEELHEASDLYTETLKDDLKTRLTTNEHLMNVVASTNNFGLILDEALLLANEHFHAIDKPYPQNLGPQIIRALSCMRTDREYTLYFMHLVTRL